MNEKQRQRLESIAVYLILILILFPIRLALVRFVSDNWFVSFGVMISISVMLIYLTKKGRLGWFGRAFHRQMFKIHRGKRRYFVYTQVILITLYFGVSILAIEIGNSYIEEKEQVKEKIGVETLDEFMEEKETQLTPTDFMFGLYVLFYILFFRFDIFAIIMSTLNDMTDGYMLHISTVFFVEEIELIIILILTKLTVKKEEI